MNEQQNDQPLPDAQRAGWSKAARRRRARRFGATNSSSPLGTVIERGDGYTVYTDDLTGTGQVQIWDRS